MKAGVWCISLGIKRVNDSAQRRAARLSSVVCCSELPPQRGTFPFVTMLKMWKSWPGSEGEGSKLHNTCALRGGAQVQMERSSLFCTAVWNTHLEIGVWEAFQLWGAVGLCSHSNTSAGQGPALTAELWNRNWSEARMPGSHSSACYSVVLGLPGGTESRVLSQQIRSLRLLTGDRQGSNLCRENM